MVAVKQLNTKSLIEACVERLLAENVQLVGKNADGTKYRGITPRGVEFELWCAATRRTLIQKGIVHHFHSDIEAAFIRVVNLSAGVQQFSISNAAEDNWFVTLLAI